jgi:hypothetical protein
VGRTLALLTISLAIAGCGADATTPKTRRADPVPAPAPVPTVIAGRITVELRNGDEAPAKDAPVWLVPARIEKRKIAGAVGGAYRAVRKQVVSRSHGATLADGTGDDRLSVGTAIESGLAHDRLMPIHDAAAAMAEAGDTKPIDIGKLIDVLLAGHMFSGSIEPHDLVDVYRRHEAVPAFLNSVKVAKAKSDAAGRFSLGDVPPGSYLLYAVHITNDSVTEWRRTLDIGKADYSRLELTDANAHVSVKDRSPLNPR